MVFPEAPFVVFIIDTTYTTLPQNFTLHVTDHKGRFPFDVKLHPVKRPGWNYPQADKVLR